MIQSAAVTLPPQPRSILKQPLPPMKKEKSSDESTPPQKQTSLLWSIMAFVLLGGGLVAAYTVFNEYKKTKEQQKEQTSTPSMQALEELKRRNRLEQNILSQTIEQETTQEEIVHPLQLARQKKSLAPIKRHYKVKGTKRSRQGNPIETNLELEDYDMTDEFPYDAIKVYDVFADGDCLFHCVRKVLHDLNIQVSIKDLRTIVARSVGEKEFTMLHNIYSMAVKANEHDLINDYHYMQNVQTVSDLRRAILTTDYFGDEMALRAIENAYPVKFMVIRILENNRIELSRRFSDEEVNNKPWFSMLLLNMKAVHYELISYNDKNVMRREELPLKIQRLMKQREKEEEQRRESEKTKTIEEKPQEPEKSVVDRMKRAGPIE